MHPRQHRRDGPRVHAHRGHAEGDAGDAGPGSDAVGVGGVGDSATAGSRQERRRSHRGNRGETARDRHSRHGFGFHRQRDRSSASRAYRGYGQIRGQRRTRVGQRERSAGA